ncbi:hypothetical protein J4464_05800 [Candidatus Woesearchaeota archaeon]|nr:hypothetical protein [Candidatus Woesearchaeota archaeon]
MRLWVVVLLILAVSCSSNNAQPQQDRAIEGIRFSDWYFSEKYQRDIIDIQNFDIEDHVLNVTTICFGPKNSTIARNDSEILTLPKRSQWAWIPVCPEETTSYMLDVFEVASP